MKNTQNKLIFLLRKKTNAPIIECKKAIIESNGDILKAQNNLKLKFNFNIDKFSKRNINCGKISISLNKKKSFASIIKIGCETDFVSKNKNFSNFSKYLSDIFLIKSIRKIKKMKKIFIDGNKFNNLITNLINITGENIKILSFLKIKSNELIYSYLHDDKIGILVDFIGKKEIGRDISMHVAANQPLMLSKDDAKKINIDLKYKFFFKKSNLKKKPKILIRKIVNGLIEKHFKNSSLLSQIFIKDSKKKLIFY